MNTRTYKIKIHTKIIDMTALNIVFKRQNRLKLKEKRKIFAKKKYIYQENNMQISCDRERFFFFIHTYIEKPLYYPQFTFHIHIR